MVFTNNSIRHPSKHFTNSPWRAERETEVRKVLWLAGDSHVGRCRTQRLTPVTLPLRFLRKSPEGVLSKDSCLCTTKIGEASYPRGSCLQSEVKGRNLGPGEGGQEVDCYIACGGGD